MPPIKLSLGAGKVDLGKTWTHIDNLDAPHISSKVIYPLPYKPDSVKLIYASHVLEYYCLEDAIQVLTNWHSVLKKGGILRLAVPDFAQFASLYSEGVCDLTGVMWPITGELNVNGEKIFHKTIWDERQLTGVLDAVGFSGVRAWDWRTTPPHNKKQDCSTSNRVIDGREVRTSLNLEGVK